MSLNAQVMGIADSGEMAVILNRHFLAWGLVRHFGDYVVNQALRQAWSP